MWTRLAVWGFFAVFFAVSFILGTAAEKVLDNIMPAGWEMRLIVALLFVGLFYTYSRLEKLEGEVRNLTRRLDQLSKRGITP